MKILSLILNSHCKNLIVSVLTKTLFLILIFSSYNCSNTKKMNGNSGEVDIIDTTKLSNYSADSLYKMSIKYFYEYQDTLNGNILFRFALNKGSVDAMLDNALQEIESGDKKLGFDVINSLYYKKEPKAYYELGKIVLKKDINRGLCLLDSSVILGNNGLAYLMSIFYYTGKSNMIDPDIEIPIDTVKALTYLKISANEKDRLGQFNLAEYYLEKKMYDSAIKYYNKCIENNSDLDEDEIDLKDFCNEQLNKIDSILKIKK